MATPRRYSPEIEEARAKAVHEIDRTELALIDGLNDAPNPISTGQKGGEWAYNAAHRRKYINTLQANVSSFRAQANELARAGNLQELEVLAQGESQ